MKLYHGSHAKIVSFDNSKAMFFSAKRSDSLLAIGHWYNDEPVEGYVYEVEINDFELTSDFMAFHTGEVLLTSKKDVVKMESKDVDNYWFAIRNINNFNPSLIEKI